MRRLLVLTAIFLFTISPMVFADTATDTTDTQESTTPVPETGFDQTTALIFSGGVLLLASYLYIWGGDASRKSFDKKMIKES